MNRIALPLAAALLLLAPAAAAQTYHAFGTTLSGANEVPPNGSPGVGFVGVVFVDNPSPFPDGLIVGGTFAELTANYSGSHLHEAPAGQNGPIVQALNAALAPDNRSGEWRFENNTFVPAPAGILAKLQAGTIYVNVHSTAFPGGEIRGQLAPIPLLDGDLSDAQYETLAVKQNANMGFGPDIDAHEIVYYADLENEVLFLGIKGKLNTASNDGIGLWLDFDGVDGLPAGYWLGDVVNAGHFMGGIGTGRYEADFEVDYAFALNPGGGASAVYFDAVKYHPDGLHQADYLGSTDQSGTPAFGPPDDTNNNGGPAFFRALAFAFDNSGGADTGLEFAIPFSELGITGGEGFTLRAFAFVVSSTAYFSDVTVPGNVTAGNLGFNPDFEGNLTDANCACPNPSAPIGTGPYHATASLSDCEQSLSATLDNTNPAPGQTITFTVTVTNHAASPAPLDLWVDATGPVSRRLRLASGTLPPGATVTRAVRLRIPGNAPSGQYALDLNIGSFADDDVCDTVAFTLNVQVPGAGAGATDFEVLDDFFAAAEARAAAPVAAYPNPLASEARLSFALERAAEVRLAIYDVRGREVAVLLDGYAEAGAHEATFDASALPSGVYVYRLQVADPARGAGARVETGRLTVLR